ncbi:DNA excision repair protein ERCC-6-like [Arctopsyche grandis]|uniref:DNA excision repair protein ERCC-6-like n=1 Tax=Arctopsyche grandis TaxID=121162 RepID=UPI00406D9B5A
MLDINKYLEDQKRLSDKRNKKCETTKEKSESPIILTVSTTSNSVVPNEEPSTSFECNSSGSEYCPSEGELEEDIDKPSSSKCSFNRKQTKVKKYVDDANIDTYKARVQEWKASFMSSPSKDADCSNVSKYIREKGDFHEIDEGFALPHFIWKKLYKYQKTGVKWLWELHQMDTGGLLGDEMGLGKTVQMIAFLAAIGFSGRSIWGGLGPCIIVAPATVLHQWVMHFHEWWPPVRVAVLHQSGSFTGSPSDFIREIHVTNGVLITTYAGIAKHFPSMENYNWHYLILDEGHKIRNADTQISKAVRRIKTSHRIVMTGSPLQNNLQELWSLFDFMSPGLLGSLPAFMEHFSIPITQGGYSNATSYQESLALSLAIALKDTITPYMLRRTKDDVIDHIKLPEKSEQVLFCSLTDEQKDLYKSFLSGHTVRSILDKESRIGDPMRARILVGLTTLRKICNHPDLYIYEIGDDIPEESELVKQSFGFWRRAGKMIVINSLLRIWKKQGHRVLIFTQSRAMLCILEQFLEQHEYKYLRMDGATSIGSRQPLIKLFNSDDSYLVFLSTTRVGGLGVNLTGADRVIIYDPDWNPATDSQAKERAWRIGQLRNVTVYRLLSAGTIEEKIYQRQVFKQLLSNKVLLDPNQKNYLKTSNLQGLFCLEEPDKSGSTETANIFKHTKVEPDKKTKNDKALLNGAVSFSSVKMAAMKRLAQEISKKISNNNSTKKNEDKETTEDPRERYKRKLQLPPPPPEEPPTNLINEKETNLDFAAALSEVDIVNMCSKPKYKSPCNIFDTNEDAAEENEEIPKICDNISISDVNIETVNNQQDSESSKIKQRKRKHKNKSKVSNIKHKKNRLDYDKSRKSEKTKSKDSAESQKVQDNYVLEKLFAKSGVQSALQHDKVVGLAEREERHNLKTETQQRAMYALKALRRSRVKHWRW